MATTVSSFSAIDDNEVDAESPITESLVTRLRDNSYWIDPASTRTSATSNTLVLTPNQTAGTTQWQEIGDISGIDGTKGVAPSIGAVYQVVTSKISDKFLKIEYSSNACNILIDTSDDSFVSNDGTSGTITAGGVQVYNISSSNVIMRISAGNYEIVEGGSLTWNAGMYYYL